MVNRVRHVDNVVPAGLVERRVELAGRAKFGDKFFERDVGINKMIFDVQPLRLPRSTTPLSVGQSRILWAPQRGERLARSFYSELMPDRTDQLIAERYDNFVPGIPQVDLPVLFQSDSKPTATRYCWRVSSMGHPH